MVMLTLARSGWFSSLVFAILLMVSRSFSVMTNLRTSLSLWKPICPTAIAPSLRKFDHGVYTTTTEGFLQPGEERHESGHGQTRRGSALVMQ